MKKLIKKSLLMGVMITTLVTAAMSKDITINGSIVDAKTVNFSLTDLDGGLNIYIKDIHGVILYCENVQKVYQSKGYDLSLLPMGEYHFEFDSKTKIRTIPFSVSKDKVNLKDEIQTIYFKPTLRLVGSSLYISKLALDNEDLEIVLLDSKWNLVYQNKLSNETNLNSILDLSKLNSGKYSVVVKSGGKTFKKLVEI